MEYATAMLMLHFFWCHRPPYHRQANTRALKAVIMQDASIKVLLGMVASCGWGCGSRRNIGSIELGNDHFGHHARHHVVE